MTKPLMPMNTYAPLAFDYATVDGRAGEVAQEAAARIRDLQKAAIVDIGRELDKVKEALDHGQFTRWIEAEFSWSHSTALNFMRVADTIGDKFATVANLPPAVIYKLAAPSTPDEVRERVLGLEEGQRTSGSTVMRLIRESKERRVKAEVREMRRRRKDPSPEDLAKEARAQRRLQREEKVREAEREERVARATHWAAELRETLGDRLHDFHAYLKQSHSYFLTEALSALLAPDQAGGSL